jgi:hypothetical protein
VKVYKDRVFEVVDWWENDYACAPKDGACFVLWDELK